MNIKFAFAVIQTNTFGATHFGDADKYLIFKWDGEDVLLQDELINKYKSFDETQEHGSKKKGKAIIELLQEKDVRVLVSKQFGPNIKMVNRFFIPVIIYNETIDEVKATLSKHIHWIEDELRLSNERNGFKLFTIKKGILKTVIKEK